MKTLSLIALVTLGATVCIGAELLRRGPETQVVPPSAGQPAQTVAERPAAPQHNFARWEKEIAAYEASDRTNPPPKGGALFIGSSTIRLWKTLATDFPDHKVINRGFGRRHSPHSDCTE